MYDYTVEIYTKIEKNEDLDTKVWHPSQPQKSSLHFPYPKKRA